MDVTTLLKRHEGITVLYAKRTYFPVSPAFDLDDAIQVARIACLRAIAEWRPDRAAQLHSWIAMHVRWAILKELKRYGRTRAVELHEADLLQPEASSVGDGDAEAWWSRAAAVLKPDDAEIVRLRFREGLTLGAIGATCGRTKERIRQRLARALALLHAHLESDGTWKSSKHVNCSA